MAQKFLCVYHDWLATLQAIGYERAGRLLVGALQYDITGEPPDLDGNLKFVWPLIQASIDRNHEHYQMICETNRRNAAIRYDRMRPDATACDGSKENIKEENKTEEEEKTTQEKKADAFREFAMEEVGAEYGGDLYEALREFSAFRTKMKAPLTDNAKARLLSRLKTFPPHQWIDILHQSVDKGWKDIYPLKKDEPSKEKVTNNIFMEIGMEEGIF